MLDGKLNDLELVFDSWLIPDALADELRAVFRKFYKEMILKDIEVMEKMKGKMPGIGGETGKYLQDKGYNGALSSLIDSKKQLLENIKS